MTRVAGCEHVPARITEPRSESCEECGSRHSLRLCSTCGHVGCCESQRGDARAHALGEEHPVVKSLPLGDRSFTWCYACNAYV
ncbi:MAG: UBP-type zinc finger domain-containing protein [Chloroflexi bacterium]|nr:UBP-type zinc finger domain-containing protein [Chloroflexota bacterium]